MVQKQYRGLSQKREHTFWVPVVRGAQGPSPESGFHSLCILRVTLKVAKQEVYHMT